MKLYWKIRWAIWNAKEHLTVKWIAHYMKNSRTLYVHPRWGENPEYVVITYEDWGRYTKNLSYESWEPHNHIESTPGRKLKQ